MEAKRPDQIAEEMERERRKDMQGYIFAIVMVLLALAVVAGGIVMSIIG